MNLQISKFDEKQIEKNGVGAGIIPISIDSNDNYHVLLAKEKYNPSWKQSSKWSGFEGGRKGMESVLETAAREFKEESLEVIYSPSSIEEILISKKYNLRLVINIQHERNCTKYHSTYIFQVPWQPECVQIFDNVKNRILNIQECGDILHTLSKAISGYRINEYGEPGMIKGITNVEQISETKMSVDCWVEENSMLTEKEFVTGLCQPLLLWQYARQVITFIIGDFSHSALEIYKDCNKLVYKINVNEDYLEKEKMQWWDIDSLKKVVKNGGHYETEYFKSYFMPVLQCLLSSI